MTERYAAAVIGTSAGGFDALCVVLGSLPVDLPLTVLVVQHLHPDPISMSTAELLNEAIAFEVVEAEEKQPLRPGVATIAPANYHLLVDWDRTTALSVDRRVCFARPSIDVLFESAAAVYRESLIGAVLTGANSDGARGLLAVAEGGGTTIVQDPATAYASAMPQAALDTAPADYVLPLDEIGSLLVQLAGEPSLSGRRGGSR